MRLFQAPLDTCLDSPLLASLSVHGLHFTVYTPSKFHVCKLREMRSYIRSLRNDNKIARRYISSKPRGRERKGPPEIIQKFRLRKWPISSADFLPFWEKDFGAISGGLLLPAPLFYC